MRGAVVKAFLKAKEKPIEEDEEEEETSTFDESVSELLKAIKAGDKQALGEALRACIDSCGE